MIFGRRSHLETTAALERRVSELERGLEAARRDVSNFRLDYESLYEKVRTTLSKLRKRADSSQSDEPEDAKGMMAAARAKLAERKLRRMGGV